MTSGNGLAPLTPTSLIYAKGANNTYDVVLSYGHKLTAGTYVVTLNSPGLTDLAGNMLIETRLVAYPQQTNSPNPDYIAQIIVTSTGATSAPQVYISAADIKAAQAYAKYLQSHTVVRVRRSEQFAFGLLTVVRSFWVPGVGTPPPVFLTLGSEYRPRRPLTFVDDGIHARSRSGAANRPRFLNHRNHTRPSPARGRVFCVKSARDLDSET